MIKNEEILYNDDISRIIINMIQLVKYLVINTKHDNKIRNKKSVMKIKNKI